MKKFCLIILMAIILGQTACGTEEESGLTEDAEMMSVAVEGTEKMASAKNDDDVIKEMEAVPYYGEWKVVDFLAPHVTVLSTEEMENYMDVRLTYAEDFFKTDAVSISQPVYNEEVVSEESFANGYDQNVTFETLHISADSVLEGNVVDSSAFGSTFYVVDNDTLYITLEGAFFKAVRQVKPDAPAFELTDGNKEFLENICRTIDDFAGTDEMDETFWKDFLFFSYTGAWGDEVEIVRIPREDLGFDETVIKVSLDEVENYTRLVFGVEWPGMKPAYEDMVKGQTSCYYQDGFYYIGVSDFPDYRFNLVECRISEEDNNHIIVRYSMDIEDENNVGTVTLTLKAADNANGFILTAKTCEFAPAFPTQPLALSKNNH